MRHAHRPRPGRFLHVVLGMVVGMALMAVVAGLIVAVNFEILRRSETRVLVEQERTIEDLRKQVEQLRVESQLLQARQERERIREDIERSNQRIRDLQRAWSSSLAGHIKSASGELAEIDVGSDLGLEMNSAVRVYRSPLMQEFLGTLQLLSVEPGRAKGLFTPARAGDQIRVGDVIVAAKPRA
jgi:FtsZ-binding cell division protein ZapB